MGRGWLLVLTTHVPTEGSCGSLTPDPSDAAADHEHGLRSWGPVLGRGLPRGRMWVQHTLCSPPVSAGGTPALCGRRSFCSLDSGPPQSPTARAALARGCSCLSASTSLPVPWNSPLSSSRGGGHGTSSIRGLAEPRDGLEGSSEGAPEPE